ncbi:proline rich transmembrane protein 1B-like [Carassius carassius]|uniref:proline rich transmembrane protein 1B-like n=1 Tax=Carassius carassius TaxID=217509 RepID=UPI002868E611|nr:proline rich transmembrane protein 1B-like [Carassius carassius]
MDSAAPPNIPDDRTHPGPLGLQEAHDSSRQREATTLPSVPAYDSVSILTAGPLNDTDSIQTSHHAYDTDSNRTLNPAFDTDSTHTLHPPYTSPAGGDASTSSVPANPPPYSPPDPKTVYVMYPQYPNQPVIACQPGANLPGAFYQPSFLPSSTYPSYTIYMNGPPLGEEHPPLPKDYLVESLLVTIFCCLMSGLVAVMYSYETRAALTRGDIREAEKTSQKARLLVMFSLMFGIFIFVGWIIYVVTVLCP